MAAYINMKEEGNAYPQAPPDYAWKPSPPDVPQGATTSGSRTSSTAPIIDPEDLQPKNISFTDESIRKGFIRKVYLILMAQLMCTFGVVALFLFHRPTQEFTQRNPGLLLAAVIVTFVVVIAMACCESTRRTFPTNFICLGIFTAAESFLIGAVASTYKSEEVFLAVGITAVLCLVLTVFAMQTKYDFTMCGGILLISLFCLIIFGFVAMIWPSYMMKTVYSCCGALLACIFLIYDTQIMMGGHHKYAISPEEYIFAALNLYLDVVRIFMHILALIGRRN